MQKNHTLQRNMHQNPVSNPLHIGKAALEWLCCHRVVKKKKKVKSCNLTSWFVVISTATARWPALQRRTEEPRRETQESSFHPTMTSSLLSRYDWIGMMYDDSIRSLNMHIILYLHGDTMKNRPNSSQTCLRHFRNTMILYNILCTIPVPFQMIRLISPKSDLKHQMETL